MKLVEEGLEENPHCVHFVYAMCTGIKEYWGNTHTVTYITTTNLVF